MNQPMCWFCDRPVDPKAPKGVSQYVKGWVPNRKGGGANQVRLMESLGFWAHDVCVDEAGQTQVNRNQEQLFS